jgi:ribosomal protein S18 acetylase RimI-like enzyme
MSEIFTSGDFSKYAKNADLAAARGPIKDILDKAKEVARRIHEKYEDDKKEPTGNQNCLLCSWCAEAMLRGIDILPRPVYSPRDPALGITPEDMLKGSVEKRYFKNFSDMQKWYLDQHNARFYVHVKWKDGNGGHEFLLLRTNVPHVLDAQQGLFSPVVDMKTFKEYFGDIDYNETYMCRIDNHDLDIENLKQINNDSAIVAWDEEKDIQYMRDHDMMSDDDEQYMKDHGMITDKEKYTMRNATESDLEFVYQSELETVGENKDDPKVQRYIRKDAKESLGHTKIIVVDRKDAGVYQAYATNYYGLREGKRDWWYLAHIYLKPEYRSKGIGSSIIKKDMGEHDKILLQVMKSNTKAKKLYESLGFVVDMENDHGGLVMRYDRSKLKQESFQEGASQDIRNGVNPNSKKLFFHVTSDPNLDGQVFKPRVPDYLDEYDPEDTSFENTTTPRVCFSPSIEGCINAIAVNFMRINPIRFEKLYVYIPEKPIQEYRHKTNKELIHDKDVFDANVTREMWILEPVRLKLYGVIRIDQWKKVHRKSTVPTVKNEKDTRPYYTIKWHWLVKPKVVASTEKSQYKYDTSTVCRNLGLDLNKFKYGLIRDGRLITHDNTAEDYEKYWRYHTGEEVDKAGGGNCYDMVEYEGGYLDAYGIPYKKYYLAPTYDDKYSSHTFIVVPNDGKFIYIEKAFKMVSDQFENNKKEFDSLDDVFDFLLENICEYERLTTLNYIIIDYTDIEFKSGTDIKHFRDYILNHGDEVREKKYTLEKKGK